ncbi:hypothetical protein Q3G72_018575 [Acer saccharum]|nr:hypothetical protein Q3G72_018575 [Acer saccharum]
MHSIINHPKVDRLVFNNDNDNAVDIEGNNDSPAIWIWHEIIRWFLIEEEIHRGRRLMSNDKYGEGKENKSNPAVSSKSKDGDENGIGNGNGNDRRSRDDYVKKARQNELVAATLIATVTFAAGLAVFNHLSLWPHLDAHKTGSDTKLRLGTYLIVLAMLAMIGAFLSGTCAVLYRDRNLAISACVVPVAVLAFLALVNLTEDILYWFLGLTNRKSLYNLVCVLDELWYEISQGGFKNLIRNKVCSK